MSRATLREAYLRFSIVLILFGMLKKGKHAQSVIYGMNMSGFFNFPHLRISQIFFAY